MKLLYLYMDGVGPLESGDFNFDSDWHFSYVGHEGEGVRVLYKRRLPKNFYGDNGVVGSVSVVVGMNGAGKTSLAASLAQVLRQEPTLKAYGYRGRYKRYCAVMQDGERLKIYSNFPIGFDEHKIELLPDFAKDAIVDFNRRRSNHTAYEFLGEDVSLFYYSPVVTTERVMFGTLNVASRDVISDLSSTTILTNCGTWREYQINERKGVLTFLRAANVREVDVKAKDRLGMSLPKDIYVCDGLAENADVGTLLLPSDFDQDGKYQDLRGVLEAGDNIAKSLVAFVATAIPVKDMLPNLLAAGDDRVDRRYHAWGLAIVDAVSTLYRDIGLSFEGVVVREKCSKGKKVRAYETFCIVIRDVIEEMIKAETDDRQELEFCSFVTEVTDSWNGDAVCKELAFYDLLWDLAKRNDSVVDECGVRIPLGSKGAVNAAAQLLEMAATYQWVGDWKADFGTAISSGEMAYCSMFARLYASLPASGNVLLFMDEAETTLHPDCQAHLVERIVRFLEIFFPKLHVHIVFATHSPILLSDVPDGNVIFLEKLGDGMSRVMEADGRPRHTFAANVFDLYRNSFFMHDGTVGGFARSKLDAIMMKICDVVQGKNKEALSAEEWELVELVGDPQAKKYFESVKSLIEQVRRKSLS